MRSNLGWRIISKFILNDNEFEKLLIDASEDNAKNIYEMIGKDHKKKINKILKHLRAIKGKREIKEEDLYDCLKYLGINPFKLAKETLLKNIAFYKAMDPALRKIYLRATTVQSSKGLSADYVFITNFDDRFFIKNKDKAEITDKDIRNFLVALTRAKKEFILCRLRKNFLSF